MSEDKIGLVEKTEFRMGDIVYLKSGSPQMMVTKITKKDRVIVDVAVAWMGDQKINRAVFPVACLSAERPAIQASWVMK